MGCDDVHYLLIPACAARLGASVHDDPGSCRRNEGRKPCAAAQSASSKVRY